MLRESARMNVRRSRATRTKYLGPPALEQRRGASCYPFRSSLPFAKEIDVVEHGTSLVHVHSMGQAPRRSIPGAQEHLGKEYQGISMLMSADPAWRRLLQPFAYSHRSPVDGTYDRARGVILCVCISSGLRLSFILTSGPTTGFVRQQRSGSIRRRP